MRDRGRIIEGTYGFREIPCTIYEYRGWYVVDGGVVVNLAPYPEEDLFDGVDIECIRDIDCMTSWTPINSLDELIDFVDE